MILPGVEADGVAAVDEVGDIRVGEPGDGVFQLEALLGRTSMAGGGARRVFLPLRSESRSSCLDVRRGVDSPISPDASSSIIVVFKV